MPETDFTPKLLYVSFLLDNAYGHLQDFEEVKWGNIYEDDGYFDEDPYKLAYFKQAKGGKFFLPSRDDWRRFRERLEALNVFRWESRPMEDSDEDICDWMPPSWDIKIRYSDMSIDIHGPLDKLPPNGTLEPEDIFKRFCESISVLMGGHPFGHSLVERNPALSR